MPSLRGRIALTLDHDLKRILDDLADAMGKPTTKVIAELLQELAPQLENTTKIVLMAKVGNNAGIKRVLGHMVGDAAASMMMATQGELPLAKKRTK